MDITKKLEYVAVHVRSVSRHDDVDAAVRLAAMERIKQLADAESEAIEERLNAQIEATVGKQEAAS